MAKKKAPTPGIEALRAIAKSILADIAGEPGPLEITSTEVGQLAAHWLSIHPEPKPLPTNLTPRQLEIFSFMKDQITNHQTTPTIREICAKFGIRSPNGVMCHMKALARKGVLTQHDGAQARNWRIVAGY